MRHLESHIQQECVKWARLQYPLCRKLLVTFANGYWTTPVQARIAVAEGLVSGASDLILLHPSWDGRWCGLAIEMKTPKGRQSENQKAWQKELEKTGCYRYEVVRSFDQFKELIDEYLKGQKSR